MQRDNVENGMETKSVRCSRGSHVFNYISKARFELAPSEEERHLKPPPWTARPSRHSRTVTSHGRCMSRAQTWAIYQILFCQNPLEDWKKVFAFFFTNISSALRCRMQCVGMPMTILRQSMGLVCYWQPALPTGPSCTSRRRVTSEGVMTTSVMSSMFCLAVPCSILPSPSQGSGF